MGTEPAIDTTKLAATAAEYAKKQAAEYAQSVQTGIADKAKLAEDLGVRSDLVVKFMSFFNNLIQKFMAAFHLSPPEETAAASAPPAAATTTPPAANTTPPSLNPGTTPPGAPVNPRGATHGGR